MQNCDNNPKKPTSLHEGVEKAAAMEYNEDLDENRILETIKQFGKS